MPDEEVDVTPHSSLMSAEEIYQLAKVFVELGVNKIRLTGGEPLMRKDTSSILSSLGNLGVKLTMTTNGVLLDRYFDELQLAGVRSLNISLDTLNPMRFLALTKRDHFARVKANIDEAIRRHFAVKVNVVVMKGINECEINDFVAWTERVPVHIRFIEFMPFTSNAWQSEKVVTYADMLETISTEYQFEKLVDGPNATAKKYQVKNATGTFAIISTMTAPFCATCNRLRLTADGKLKNCLFSVAETDLLTALRAQQDIVPLIQENLLQKAARLGGQFDENYTQMNPELLQNRQMISIGG